MRGLVCFGAFAVGAADDSLWSVIVDVGSTGSRLYTYHIDADATDGSVYPGGVVVRRGDKVKPGLAAFSHDHEAAALQLAKLFEGGAALVPVARRARARAIIRCTGGVRDELDAVTRTALLDAVFAALSANASFPFSLAREDVGVVEGPQEAFYAFVSANFLEGRVDHLLRPRGESAQLLGALDLGGSSTQITYAMSGAESCAAAEDCANESVEPAMLYARSYASFGAQAVRKKMLERLRAAGAGEDPCSHVGYEVGEGLTGGGALEACAVEVRGALLGDARAQTCADADSPQTRRAKCALDGGDSSATPPAPPEAAKFLAMCNYFYAADAIRVLSPATAPALVGWPTPSLATLSDVAAHFCAVPWATVLGTMRRLHPYTSDSLLPTRCFDAAYVLVLLRDVFALDDHPRVTFALDAAGGAEVEWTLGFFLATIVAAQ